MEELDIKAIQQLIANGQLEQALTHLNKALADNPNYSDAHYMAAVCQRYSKRYEQAQQHLDAIKHISGDTGRIYQEQGHLYKAQGDTLSALGAFQAATQFNPALIASWKSQAQLLQTLNKAAETQQALAQIHRLQSLPKALLSVTDLIAQGKHFKAEALCKSFLQGKPKHTEGLRLLADIATRLGAMQEAEFILESASDFDSSNTQVKIDYIQLLRKRQKYEASTIAAQKLLLLDPNNAQFLSLFAIAKMQVGEIVEEWQPKDRINLTLTYNLNKLQTNLAFNRYGEYTVVDSTEQTYGAEILTDINLRYNFDSGVSIFLSGNNIFDVTPDETTNTGSRGGLFESSPGAQDLASATVFRYSRRSAPFGFNGAFFSAGVSYDF